MVKLFDGIPDVKRVAADAALDAVAAEGVLMELGWVTKTISRLGKGYLFGDHGFSRPQSTADRELTVANELGDEYEASPTTAWVFPDELAETLAERTGFGTDVADAVIASVTEQVEQHGGRGMKVATKLLELERVVEDQLIDDPSVLEIWGWGLTDVRRQVRLDAANRADLIGRGRDGTWVVVELKRGAALAETADQVLRYMLLVREKFAGGDPVVGLVIADGDDEEFHDRVLGVEESISYLPTRALNLPACRAQTHRVAIPELGPDGAAGTGSITVAADGITVVGAAPSAAAFDLLEPPELWSAGRRVLDGNHVPIPVAPLVPPS